MKELWKSWFLLEFNNRITKIIKQICIQFKNHANREIHRIPSQNDENHEELNYSMPESNKSRNSQTSKTESRKSWKLNYSQPELRKSWNSFNSTPESRTS